MESLLLRLHNLLKNQNTLLQELLSYLEKEQQCIINLSIDQLYEITKLKETNILKMKLLKESVQDVLARLAPMVDLQNKKMSLVQLIERIPHGHYRQKVKEAHQTALFLARSIETRNQGNKSFIQESLRYIDDSISMLTNSHQKLGAYHQDGRQALSPAIRRLLSREV